jgi:phage terminase large subunit-like protein
MAMQELLIEKYYLEADSEKGTFSFSSEYQLDPVETKGRHFDVSSINYFDYEKWIRIKDNTMITKYTWIDVGYSEADPKSTKKRKDVKTGKTAMATLCRVTGEEAGMLPSDRGIYILDVRSGDYFVQDMDIKKSLVGEMLKIYEMFHPEMYAFEDNFFGKYVRKNMQMFNEYHLPVTGRLNRLDKMVRISNGINAILADPSGGLWLCERANGYQTTIRQLTEFPYATKMDEIDAIESGHRLLVKESDKVVIIGDMLDERKQQKSLMCKTCPKYIKDQNFCDEIKEPADAVEVCPLNIRDVIIYGNGAERISTIGVSHSNNNFNNLRKRYIR